MEESAGERGLGRVLLYVNNGEYDFRTGTVLVMDIIRLPTTK